MLMIFGANGKSGRELVRRLDNKQQAIAVLRLPENDGFFRKHTLPTTVADALDADAVTDAVQQYRPDAVVSFVGGKNEQGFRSDAAGNINIIRAVAQYAPQARMVLITSMGCGDQHRLMSEPFKQALGEAVAAKTEAETFLRQSGLRWIILRPCGLANGEEPSFRLHTDMPSIPRQYMNRSGLAAAVCQILSEEGHEGRIYSVTSG